MSKIYRKSYSIIGIFALSMIAICISIYTNGDPEEVARPLLLAIQRYRDHYGKFPADLIDLVDKEVISIIPVAESNLLNLVYGFNYFVDADLDFFCLSFDEQPRFGGLGPARCKTRAFVSFFGYWMRESNSNQFDFPQPLGLSMTRSGSMYQKTHSSRDLDMFVKKIIQYSYCNTKYEKSVMLHDVTASLGNPTFSDKGPPRCVIYEASFDHATRYRFDVFGDNSGMLGIYGDRIVSISKIDNNNVSKEWREIVRFK